MWSCYGGTMWSCYSGTVCRGRIVVVVVSVTARAVLSVGMVVVVLPATPLAQRVWRIVVPQELSAWLPVRWLIPSIPALEEGEVLHHVQVKVKLVVECTLHDLWWLMVRLTGR